MNFFGDSITAALSAQDQPGRIYYPWWLSLLRGDPLPTVLAMAGNGAADQAASAYNTTKDDSFLLIGTNDRLSYRVGGVTDPNGVALFKNIVTAMSYWITGDMVPAQQAGWAFAGSWSNYVGPPWAAMGKYANAAGSVATSTFNGDVLLLGYTMADGGGMGSATVKVDGVALGVPLSCTPPRTIALSAGHSPYAPGVYRASGFGAGLHTVTITTNSNAFVMLDWRNGAPAGRSLTLLTLPKTANGDDAEVATYNAVFPQVAALCTGDGYAVAVINTGSVVRLNEMCSNILPNNNNHPNNHGHMNMALKIIGP